MATIIQKPDTLSLLDNMKSFIINSSSEVSFELYRGSTLILSETYYPNGSSQVEIDIRDVIRAYVPTPIPNLSNTLTRTNTYTFSANIDGTAAATFKVIPAGVRKLTDTAENFLRENWLTWQPQTKAVGYHSPELLSYYFTVFGDLMVKFYLMNGDTITKRKASVSAGQLETFKMEMAHLIEFSGYEPSALQGYIDVWIQDGDGNRLSYIQRYIFQPKEGDEHYYLCVNSLGGIDTFSFHGSLSLIPEVDHQIAELSDVKKNNTDSAVRKWSQNTGYLNKEQGIWLWELLSSRSQWTLSDGVLEAIVLDTSDMEVKDKDNLHSCSFRFSLAEEGKLLNIRRSSEEIPSLTVPSPGDLFFLDERLADYADAILDGSLLFAVQYPSSDEWYKTSLGAISEWIIKLITDSQMGGSIHGHTNKDVLDKFSEESGKPAFNKKPLATTEETDNKFLRKDREDRAAGHTTFEEGATFGKSFAPGVTGHGGRVDAQGNAEFRSGKFHIIEADEFRYNRVSIFTGNEWRAPGGGIIESVEIDTDAIGQKLMSGIITLKLEDGEIGTIAEDDLCQGIYHNGVTPSENSISSSDDSKGNFQFAGFCTVYFRVTEILDERKSRFRYQLRGTSDTWSFTHHPMMLMHFVAYGNLTDKDRQSSRYSALTYERYLKNVSTWEFSASNIAAQFGDLSNLNVFGLNMEGYSAYLNNIYMSGTIKQFEDLSIRLDVNTDGDPFIAWGETKHISCQVWRGYEDVTSQITSWTIVRDSGDPASDAAWLLKDKVKNFSGEFDICFNADESDIATNENTISTLFTITATMENGDSAVNILTI